MTGDFLDRSMVMDWDVELCTKKATAAGAPPAEPPLEAFTGLFERMREERWIP